MTRVTAFYAVLLFGSQLACDSKEVDDRCRWDDDCMPGLRCTTSGACVECMYDHQCDSICRSEEVCVCSAGSCEQVECATDLDCDYPLDCVRGTCLESCVTDRYCTDPARPFCGSDGLCASVCMTDEQCTSESGVPSACVDGACMLRSECRVDTDCEAGVCIDIGDGATACQVECREDRVCGVAHACSAGRCEDCAGSDACIACLSDFDCADNAACFSGYCYADAFCLQDQECPGLVNACVGDDCGLRATWCRFGKCSAATRACSENRDCRSGEVCVAGMCDFVYCEVESDCPSGYTCNTDHFHVGVGFLCRPFAAGELCPPGLVSESSGRVPRCNSDGECGADGARCDRSRYCRYPLNNSPTCRCDSGEVVNQLCR